MKKLAPHFLQLIKIGLYIVLTPPLPFTLYGFNTILSIILPSSSFIGPSNSLHLKLHLKHLNPFFS